MFRRAITHIRYCLPPTPTHGEPQATALPLAAGGDRKHRFPRAGVCYRRLVIAYVYYRDADEGRCSILLGLRLIVTLSWDVGCTDVALVMG